MSSFLHRAAFAFCAATGCKANARYEQEPQQAESSTRVDWFEPGDTIQKGSSRISSPLAQGRVTFRFIRSSPSTSSTFSLPITHTGYHRLHSFTTVIITYVL